MKRIAFALTVMAIGAAACSQPAPPPPPAAEPPAPPSRAITESMFGPYSAVKGYLVKTAEVASDRVYAFKPTPEVRSFGQILAHVADANYMFCGISSGEAGPTASVEQTQTTKAGIQSALAESFAFCDRAFSGVNDVTGAQAAVIVPINNMPTTKLGVLGFATAHQFEHYGNLVTYMRLNKMVPPSSAPAAGM